eukprot:gnl/TRDRNA2_/TRDRNA2_80891_c0_seq1.p1 gnl/TRDRNA2_/TRDRNA2_80891_c0~~gnl/TRDRNA2_/TRDRNA2_80891_c0_seq1.p1  ORF type:complete len:346 (+),score=43.31 gnl/TRDRNA2_/TRDRNA2_80891_c0_seq1:156-1193(+)
MSGASQHWAGNASAPFIESLQVVDGDSEGDSEGQVIAGPAIDAQAIAAGRCLWLRRRRRCCCCSCCCKVPCWSIPVITYFVLLPFVYMITYVLMYPGVLIPAPADFSHYCPSCEEFNFPSSHGGGNIPAIRLPPAESEHLAVPAIVLGGNGMNMYDSIYTLPKLLPPDKIWDVYSVSYPGFAPRSSDWMSEVGCLQDIKDLLRFIRKRTGKSALLLGWSLGTAVAAGVAAEMPGDARCLVLGNPFTDMWTMGIHFSHGALAPWVYVADTWRTEHRVSEDWAGRVPLVVLSGTRDEMIPIWMHTAVYKAATSLRKQLIEAPSSHMDFEAFVGDPLDGLLREWCADP